MKKSIILVLLLMVHVHVLAKDASSLRDLTDEDVAAWSQMYGAPLLSPNGKWFVYVWSAYERVDHARRGVPQLIVRATDGNEERRYPLGTFSGGYSKVSMSPSGKWIAYTKPGTPGRTAGAVMELDSGNRWELGNAQDFQFSEDERWIVVNEGADDGTAGHYSVNVQALSGHREGQQPQHRWSGVREHALGAAGRRIAFLDEQGVHIQELGATEEYVLSSAAGDSYQFLRWSPKGKSLALVRQHGGALQVVVLSSDKAQWRDRVFDPRRWEGFPGPYEIAGFPLSMSQQGPMLLEVLKWREAEDGIYFYIQQKPIEGPKQADLILWHWKDPWIPAAKQQPATGVPAPPERHLSYLSLPEGRFVRLADERVGNVIPQGRGKYALGFSWKQYGTSNAYSATNFIGAGIEKRDYALVDLRTGVRTWLADMKGLEVRTRVYWRNGYGVGVDVDFRPPEPRMSPDGAAVVFLDKSNDYCVYDVGRARFFNATKGVPGWQYDLDYAKTDLLFPGDQTPSLQGWTSDGQAMLTSDGHDVWQIPLRDGQARNLTGNGRSGGFNYGYTDVLSPRKVSGQLHLLAPMYTNIANDEVNLDRPLYFKVVENKTQRSGLAVLMPGARSAQIVNLEDASVEYFRAHQASALLMQRETMAEGSNYFVLDENGKRKLQLTDSAPQQQEFQWPTGRRLTFKTQDGEDHDALLFLPPRAREEKPLPAITYVYVGVPVSHWHVRHNPADPLIFRWLRQGYAVIAPNIISTRASPGPDALKITLGAVQAAVATGLVDEKNVGIQGHSFGSYETYYIISRSNVFKAAVSLAGISNPQSGYGLLDSNVPGSLWMENNHIPRPWWEDRAALARNSPIDKITDIRTPLLIGHGDADSVVGFSQGVELFTALRRLEDRPVVLLQYVGEEHSVDMHPDMMKREEAFFAHYLKGAPAPDWWTAGISYWKGTAPASTPPSAR